MVRDGLSPEGRMGMSGIHVVFLAVAVGLATLGQLLLKRGMLEVGAVGLAELAHPVRLGQRVLSTGWVPAGVLVFGLSAVSWLLALSRVPLSVAYPTVSLSYVVIALASVLWFGERPAPLAWAGTVLIVLGVALVGLGFSRG